MRPVAEQLPILTQGASVIPEEDLAERLARGRPLRIKLGIDPTASDIHLGFAVVLRKLRQFQDCGHLAVLILGDYTAQVGDPSGRSATRPRLSREEVDANAATYVEQISEILDPSPQRLEIRRNSEWLAPMGMDDILRLTSRTTVARMLERDDFAKRYAEGASITLTEFLYPLLQGWDSVMVRADVELGGTDQLFNLLVGRRLQEQQDQDPQVVVSTPLLVGLDGEKKMSKSLGNYIGVAEDAFSQYVKVMKLPDTNAAGEAAGDRFAVLRAYAQYATAWAQPEIDAFGAHLDAGTLHPKAAKQTIARAVCDLYHGPGAGASAEARWTEPTEAAAEIPEVRVAAGGTVRISALLRDAGLVNSVRQGARDIAAGAVRLDGVVVAEDAETSADTLHGKVLRKGKHHEVRILAI